MGKNETSVDELNKHHQNKRYLKEAKLDENIRATSDIKEAVDFTDIYLIALLQKQLERLQVKLINLLILRRYLFMLPKVLKMIPSNVFLK